MRRDGDRYIAENHLPNNLPDLPEQLAFARRFPGAWGYMQFSKVGFSTAHTQALVQIAQWCGGSVCSSREILFLKRIGKSWRVIERIPDFSAALEEKGNLRYRGPAGRIPTESEIVGDTSSRAVIRLESKDAAAVYRAVLDSLYHFQGSAPRMVVLTDRVRNPDDSLPVPRTRLDSGLLQKYRFLGSVRAKPDRAFTYRLPVKILLGDSLSRLENLPPPIDDQTGMSPSPWFGFRKSFPGAWGMVGFSRVAFNLPHTQAMVYSHHECGQYCGNGDTWVLERKGERWRVVERIPRPEHSLWEPGFFPLRYVGIDAKPQAYHHRRAYAVFMNAVTNRPLPFLKLSARRNSTEHQLYTADSVGRVDIGAIPFTGIVGLKAGCPDQSQPDSLYVLEFLFSPGPDTTLSTQIDFRQCFRTSEPHRLTGAQAFISPTEARFVFPRLPASDYWDLPERQTRPGTTDYFWMVQWRNADPHANGPIELWLSANQKPKGTEIHSFEELISGRPLDVMFECQTCDEPAVYADPREDHQSVTARIDTGRIVFSLRGRRVVNSVFPKVPKSVTFFRMVRHTPAGKPTSLEIEESQSVVVNCRSSDSTAASRRRCDLPTNPQDTTLKIDSTAPRRLKVVALSYDGASLMRNLDVRVLSEDLRNSTVSASTGQSGDFSVLQAPRDSIAIEALCPGNRRDQTDTSGKLALYLAPGRDTTVQLLVDERRCPAISRRK